MVPYINKPEVPLVDSLVRLLRGLVNVEELPELGVLLKLVHERPILRGSLILLEHFDLLGGTIFVGLQVGRRDLRANPDLHCVSSLNYKHATRI